MSTLFSLIENFFLYEITKIIFKKNTPERAKN